MPLQRWQSAGYLANHMARLFAAALSERLRPLGLAPAQFVLLLELWAGDGLTQKELVERLGVEQATVVNTLKRMERDGLIDRRPHPEDGRSQLIFITEKARALEQAATKHAEEINAVALSCLSPGKQEEFLEAMRRVIGGLQQS